MQETSSIERIQRALPRFEGAESRTWPPFSDRVAEAREAISARVFRRAKHLLKLAAKEDPQDHNVTYTTGLMQLRRQNYGAAKPLFEETLERGPTFASSSEVFFSYGRCLEGIGDVAGAREAYLAHGLLAPDHGETQLSLALLALEEGDLERTHEFLEAALTAYYGDPDGAPGIARVYASKGDLLLRSGDLEEARDAFRMGLRVDPTSSQCRYRLGRVLLLLGDAEGAERALRRFTRRSSEQDQ